MCVCVCVLVCVYIAVCWLVNTCWLFLATVLIATLLPLLLLKPEAVTSFAKQSALLSSLPSSPLSVIVSLSVPFHPNLSCPFFSHFRVFHFLSPFAFSSALQTLNSGSTQHTNAQVLASARSLTIAIYGLKDTRALEKLPLIRAYVVCQTHH